MKTTTLSGADTGTSTGGFLPRIFDSEALPADRNVLDGVVRGVSGVDLAAPPVVLPDFHHKSTMEMPSSIAVATTDTIRPTFTSASVNCGMALLALDCEMPDTRGVIEFYRRVRERYPYPPRRTGELSLQDVRQCAFEGGTFAADRFGVPAGDLLRVEEGGTLDLDRYGGADRLRRELPGLTFQLARMRFGTVGPSNHFIELQRVEEILDVEAAAALGVSEGQVTLQYHAGGGVLTGEIGAMFGARRHQGKALALAMAVQKPLFHLATARSRTQLQERFALYFRHACPPISRYSDEGQRLMLANAAAMNYGFAFRLATYSALRRIVADVFGADSRLIVDSPHNSIYEEEVDGVSAIVHRHNSCRAYPADRMADHPVFRRTGQPVLLPGTNRTSSYLCVAGSAADAALASACHGAGTIIDSFADRGLSRPDPQCRSTLRFRYDDAAPAAVGHLDDRGVDEALSILTRNGLVTPVARMRPAAVLN